MAKKISAETAKTLKNLGITAKTEEEAHDKLVAALEKEGIEGMEDESLAALIDMADGFLSSDNDEEETDDTDEVEADTEEEMDELADEVEAEEETEDEAEEDASDEEDDEPETEEEEPAKPAKKAAAPKKATKKAEKPAKEKAEKPAKKQTSSARGQKLDPKNNPEDLKVLDEIKSMFGKDYDFDCVKSNGATIKHIGKNGKRGVVLIENLTRHNNGTVTCNLYLLTMTKQTEVLDEMGIDYTLCWTKAPMMKNITLEEVKEILEKVFETITGAVVKIDKRLGDNRKKMEENLQKTEKKSAKAKKAAQPEPEPEEVEDDEEEDEEEEPAKPVKKAAPAKKAAKKAKK